MNPPRTFLVALSVYDAANAPGLTPSSNRAVTVPGAGVAVSAVKTLRDSPEGLKRITGIIPPPTQIVAPATASLL